MITHEAITQPRNKMLFASIHVFPPHPIFLLLVQVSTDHYPKWCLSFY